MSLKAFRPLPIEDVRRETDEAISISFGSPPWPFVPGQYLTLRAVIDGEEVRRSYSICSGLDDGEVRVAIKLVPGGRFSAWAHRELVRGHVLEVMPPDGRFVHLPDPAVRGTYLGVAAGSGITPVLSVLRSVLQREKDSRFVLLYGSRSTGTIMFREALEELKDRHLERLVVLHVLSREAGDVPALHGRLDGERVLRLLKGLTPASGLDAAFLCGPGGMIEDARSALIMAGLAPERVRSERFAPTGEPVRPPRERAAAAPFATATIVADGVRTAVPVASGETVLEAALRAGLDLPYSCRGGMCSTCRARITSGSVTMDVNYALEPWETEAGYVLTCQARPTSETVTADYDHV